MKICGLLLGAAIFLTACSGDEPSRPQVPDTPQLVLEALEKAYRKRDAAAYARLLADDFRFFFDEETRLSFELPDSWNRDDDVKATSRIFRDDFVDEITIQLEGGSPVPSGESGRETWLRNHVADTFLEIEMEPDDQEPDGLTLLLDGHVQTFYFRMENIRPTRWRRRKRPPACISWNGTTAASSGRPAGTGATRTPCRSTT
jgi:hypothetical protein